MTIRLKTRASAGRLLALALCLSTIFFLPLCRRQESTSLIYLPDLLDQGNILSSPFLDYSSGPLDMEKELPNVSLLREKFISSDAGTEPNPFHLKKKVAVGPSDINGLFAPPTSIYRFTVRVPAEAHLEFSYGILRSEIPSTEASPAVDFILRISTKGKSRDFMNNRLGLPSQDPLVFRHRKINLGSYAGEKISLTFMTKGNKDSLAFWFNPVVFAPQARPRNVVLVSLDTLRADRLGCYGYDRPTSPALDELAKDSVLFKNTFATSPWTLPSHVSLFTGLDCYNHQVYQAKDKISPEIVTLADILRQKGFFTAGFTGGGYVSAQFGFSKGFNIYSVVGGLEDRDAAGQLAHSVETWLQAHRSYPFFLFLHTYQIHQPYRSPLEYADMFVEEGALKEADPEDWRLNHQGRFSPLPEPVRQNLIGLYDAEVRYTDEALIRPLIQKLKDLNLYDDTLLIVTSDHGEEFYEHGAWVHSHSVYNETIQVPLLVKFFGSRQAGRRVDRFARITDIMPTILEELGLSDPDPPRDGRSLLGLLGGEGENPEERIFVSELAPYIIDLNIPRKIAVNNDKLKIILNDDFSPEVLAFFSPPPQKNERVELFDLNADPNEMADLVRRRPAEVRRLLSHLEEAMKPTRKIRAGRVDITKELREQLRTLGYIK